MPLTEKQVAEIKRRHSFSSDVPGVCDLCGSHEELRKRAETLEKGRINYFDTMHAIAVKGLGLTDPFTFEDYPLNLPDDWSAATKTDGLFSTAIAEVRQERDQLRAEVSRLTKLLEGMKTEWRGYSTWNTEGAYRSATVFHSFTEAKDWLARVEYYRSSPEQVNRIQSHHTLTTDWQDLPEEEVKLG